MPFNMFKAFSGSRNRKNRDDPAALGVFPDEHVFEQDYPRRNLLRRTTTTKRKEPIFTPLPSRTPTDGEELHEGYVQVNDPSTVMGGALNARPTRLEGLSPSLERDDRSHMSLSPAERDRSRSMGHSRLPPSEFAYAGSHRGAMAERENPDGPIIMPPLRSRSSTSSDRTIENLRTPTSVHREPRVIPPLPHHRPGGYTTVPKPPTDIYGDHPHDAYPGVRTYRFQDLPDRYMKDGHIYYIVPGGMNVIFQDERGSEITRVGDFTGRQRPARSAPFVLQDQRGRELFRYDGRDPHRPPPIIRIDPFPSRSRERSYSSPPYHPDFYRRHRDPPPGYRYQPDRRHYGSYRDRGDYRGYGEYRDHSDRGDPRYHEEHRSHGEYRDREDYRDHGDHHRDYADHADHGRHGDHDGHRRHRDYRDHEDHYRYAGYRDRGDLGRHESYRRRGDYDGERHYRQYENRRELGDHPEHEHPSSHERDGPYPVLQEPQNAHSHSSHASVSGPPQHFVHSPSDDRGSMTGRPYEGSVHAGGQPDTYEEDISHGLDAVHMN